jgi:hypothetical protein
MQNQWDTTSVQVNMKFWTRIGSALLKQLIAFWGKIKKNRLLKSQEGFKKVFKSFLTSY